MTYAPPRRPIWIVLGLGCTTIIAALGYIVFQQSKTADFRIVLARCARELGVEQVAWKPIHGFHEFYIGETIEARSPAEDAMLRCAAVRSDMVETHAREPGEHGVAQIDILFSESLFDPDTIVFAPRSG